VRSEAPAVTEDRRTQGGDTVETVIVVTASHMAGSGGQDLVSPIIEVDGVAHTGVWGPNRLVVSPGQHTLKAYHRWLVFKQAYAAETTVEVAEGQTLRLEWHTGAAAYKPGVWTVRS